LVFVSKQSVKLLVMVLLCLLVLGKAGATVMHGTEVIPLKECGSKPNCVVSLGAGKESFYIEPFPIRENPQVSFKILTSVLNNYKRTKIVKNSEGYIHATCTSLIFRFVDDVEFYLDKVRRKILVRSASRVGYSDFGVNRNRVEELRKLYLEAPLDQSDQ